VPSWRLRTIADAASPPAASAPAPLDSIRDTLHTFVSGLRK
jgi:hypothetical protein